MQVYNETEQEVYMNDSLIFFIRDMFKGTNEDFLIRAIRVMDKFGYSDYSLDVYNFINSSRINLDIDGSKLLFINLVLSHIVKLIENIGLVVSDDLVNEDYSEYIGFFIEVSESLWLVKNMTDIDAIYFSDLINNDNIEDIEIVYRILSYYKDDLKEDVFYNVIEDFKASFFNTIKIKVNDLVSTTIDDSEIDYDIKDLLLLKNINNTILNLTNNSVFGSMLISVGPDLKYLFKNKEFINKHTEDIIKDMLEYLNSKDTVNYYAFIEEDKILFSYILDLSLFKITDNIINYQTSLEEAISNSYDYIKELFYERDMKGISGIVKVLDKVKNIIETSFTEEMKVSFINFIKGNEDE